MARGRLIDKVSLDGVTELTEAFKELTRATQKNVVTRALVEAGEPVVDAAKAAAPVASGDLRDSIQASAKAGKGRRSKGDLSFAYIGPSYSKRDTDYAPHAHLVEFGTVARYHKSGKFVGQAPAQPFLRPAWDSRKQQVIGRFAEALDNQIQKAVARLERKNLRQKIKAGG